MIHRRGNWWIREIKSRFRSQKLSSKQKKNTFESERFRSAAAFQPPLFSKSKRVLLRGFCRRARMRVRRIDRAFASRSGLCSFETNARSIIVACTRRRARVLQPNCRQKKQKKSIISLLRTANKDIACLRSTVSSLDAKVTFEVRETDFTERCRFKLSVLATDAFALMWMDWTIEAIISSSIYFCVLL